LKKLLAIILLLASVVAVPGQAPKLPDKPAPAKKFKYAKGLKFPSLEKRKALHAAAVSRHGKRALPKATAAVYDCRVLGLVPPVRNQQQCGSCWDFSGCGTATCALIKGGYGKNDGTFDLSEQFVLDCGQNGGCNGDDNTTVLTQCKATGIPTDAYGPYQGSAGQCKATSTLTLYKIADWGYADPGNTSGVSDTQKIKDAIVAYGPVGCAVAAGGTPFWDSGTGTDTGTSNQIDHDVMLVGWDDTHDNGDGSKGAWIMRNSWANTWGTPCANAINTTPLEGGYAWVKYGADSIGTETVWAVATALPPTPPPNPPPGPTPPSPPVPPTPPTPAPGTTTITLTTDQIASIIAQNNAVAITEATTIKEILDAIEKCRTKPLAPAAKATSADRLDALESDVKDLKRGMAAILKALLPPEPKPLPKGPTSCLPIRRNSCEEVFDDRSIRLREFVSVRSDYACPGYSWSHQAA
jgi:Papain family cysteine protease